MSDITKEQVEEMTPRQKTFALKKLGVRIDCVYPFDDQCDYWYVEFSDGEIEHVRNVHAYKPFDGKAACEREVREKATEEKLLLILSEAD